MTDEQQKISIYETSAVICPGEVMLITPHQAHMIFELLVRMSILARSLVGRVGTQGPEIRGSQEVEKNLSFSLILISKT